MRLVSALGLMLFMACGQDQTGPSSQDDPACKDVQCEAGVCQAGECVNASDCGGEDAKCVTGYFCGDSNACVAQFACSSTRPCDRGTCQSGACLNADTCTNTGDCLSGFACGGDSKCIADPCQDDDQVCDRGVCQVGTGSCVNAQVCQSDTEGVDCLEGFRCSAGTCKDETGYCGDVDCSEKGGVCNFAATSEDDKCINAPNCGGEDSNCLKGFFCAEDGTCQEDKCEETGCVDDGGVCDKASGSCVNPATCDNKDACLNDHFCVANACVPTADACMTAGCFGTQVCENDDATLTVSCVENPDGCQTSLDCLGDRVCNEVNECAEAVPCSDDANEPNDMDGEATDYFALNSSRVQGGICGQDVDLIRFDTTQDAQETGRLIVDVEFATRRAIGLGELKAELIYKGNVVQTGVSKDGKLRLEHPVSIAFVGEYFLRVTPEGTVSVAGIPYQVTMDLLDDNVVNACLGAPALVENTTETSSTNSGGSTTLSASCADPTGVAYEDIYKIEVTQKSFISVTVDPGESSDVSVSLRSECLITGSEIPGACAENDGEGGVERVDALVEPGTYFAVVQGADETKGGTYSILWSRRDVVCTSTDGRCLNPATAEVCRLDGQGYQTVACDSGCNATLGQCNPPAGDVCGTGVLIDENTPLESYVVEWSKLSNRYGVDVTGCVPASNGIANVTSGPDQAFRVVIPANHVLVADITQEQNSVGGKTDAGLYVVKDCLSTESTCEVGTNGGDSDTFGKEESLFWANLTAGPETVYLIADTVNSGNYVGSVLNAKVVPRVCDPGSSACEPGVSTQLASKLCNETGSKYDEPVDCERGCDSQQRCANPDLCEFAPIIESGFMSTDTLRDYANDVDVTAACAGFVSDRGSDLFYAIEVPDAQILSVDMDLDSSFSTATVYIFEDCTDVSNTCLAGARNTDQTKVQWANTTGAPKTVFVGLDTTSTFVSGFNVSVDVIPPECTVVGEQICDGADVKRCNKNLVYDVLTCNGTCGTINPGRCDTPEGNLCLDAILLDKTKTSVTGTYSGSTNTITVPATATGTPTGACTVGEFRDSDGGERVYEVSVDAGERFDVSLTINSTSTSRSYQLFLFEDCNDIGSCIKNDESRGIDGTYSLSYVNTSMAAKSIFLVVDATFNQSVGFTLDYSFTANAVCSPNELVCDMAGTGLQQCDDSGAMLSASASCSGTPPAMCSFGYCGFETKDADTCATAPLVTAPTKMLIDFPTLSLDQSLTSASCTGANTSTADAFFQVSVPPSKILKVTSTNLGEDSHTLYITDDCTDVAGSCLAGTPVTSTQNYNGELTWANTDAMAKVVTVGVAETTSFGGSFGELQIEVVDPDCTVPGETRCSGNDLELCGEDLLYDAFPCDGTCGQIAAGRCDTPAGDVCADAIFLNGATGSVSGTYDKATRTAELPAPLATSCIVADFDQTDGPERFYQIDLAAGDQIEVKLTTTHTSARLFIMDGCGEPRDRCVANDPTKQSSSTPQTVRYTNTTGAIQSVFIVVDTESTSVSTAFTLDYTVTSGKVCTPSTFICDAAGTGTQRCREDGLGYDPVVSCGAGSTCNFGACSQLATNLIDTCATAPLIGGNYTAIVEASGMTNDLNPGSSCAGGGTSGNDFFYSVDVPANTKIRVSTVSIGADSFSTYILSSCMNPGGASCLAGDNGTFSNSYTNVVEWTNMGAMSTNVIIGVDRSFLSSSSSIFGVRVELVP